MKAALVVVVVLAVFEVLPDQIPQTDRVGLSYGNTGYGVSRLGLQNPVDFWLKVKSFKGFFDIF